MAVTKVLEAHTFKGGFEKRFSTTHLSHMIITPIGYVSAATKTERQVPPRPVSLFLLSMTKV